jgi:hypothetical protein
MLSKETIGQALHASRVVPLAVPKPHGPLGLEQIAAAVARVQSSDTVALSISLRRETRDTLERIAGTTDQRTTRPVTAADVVAAIVEEYVATCKGQ